MMKQVMLKAWEIAREGVKKFGGKVKEYFAEALRIAWSIVKKSMGEIKLIGTPKQVAWAEDLRKVVEVAFEIAKKTGLNSSYDNERLQNAIDFIEKEVLSQTSAKFYIDKFQSVNVRKLKEVLKSDYKYKNIVASEILQNINFKQFTTEFKEKGYKFAKGLSVLQFGLRIESVTNNLSILEEKLK